MNAVVLGTFLIGVREGLEAVLIVSIIAAFLKRNGRSLTPLWIGVASAVLLSIAVGVGLEMFSASLPQAQQEMLETIIGAVAVIFVTTMVLWMNRHARGMKRALEGEAREAIATGGAWALSGMAFLAVVKEGFETAVFLLASMQASAGSQLWGAAGAFAGIACAVIIGIGLYYGSLRLNLAAFFRGTGVFLVFIAAGLVLQVLRTAHEAGWIVIGQQQVLDLSSVLPRTSVLGAIVTGVFGIPADPRLIEVVGWVSYAVPVLILFLWPAGWTPGPAGARRVRLVGAAICVVGAAGFATLVPSAASAPSEAIDVAVDGGTLHVDIEGSGQQRTLVVSSADGTSRTDLDAAGSEQAAGVDVQVWQSTEQGDVGARPEQVSLEDLRQMTGGRLPVGLSLDRTPGPFEAAWSAKSVTTARTAEGALVSASVDSTIVATLTGGGLSSPKTVSVGGADADWSSSADESDRRLEAVLSARSAAEERTLWSVWIPLVLGVAAFGLVLSALRSFRREQRVMTAGSATVSSES